MVAWYNQAISPSGNTRAGLVFKSQTLHIGCTRKCACYPGRRRGKTVLFSSHELDTVERLCSHVVILHKGRVVAGDRGRQVIVKNSGMTKHAATNGATTESNDALHRPVRST